MKFATIIFSASILLGSTSFAQTNTPCSGGTVNATSLTVGSSCSYTSGTTVGATYSTNANNGGTPSCASPGAADVWYSFVAPASGNVTITTAAGTITDGGMSLYSGSCGAWTEIDCNDDSNGLMPEISSATLTPGTTYLIRFWEYSSGTGTFDICVVENVGAVTPANDDPCTATPLTVDASCSFNTYTTENATNSSLTAGVSLPSCSFYNGGDVWFSFVAPASGHIILDNNTGVITDGGMALYSGPCGTLTEVDCDDDGSVNGAMSFIEQTTLVPGDTYFVRIWEYGNDNPGTFDICLYDGGGTVTGPCTGGAGGSDCATMNPFCTTDTYCFTAQIGTTAEVGNDYGCLITQPNPTWYYMEISAAGNLVFDMSAGSDIDYAIWGPFVNLAAAQASCGALPAPIDCGYTTSPTETGTITGAAAGEVYIMVVTNYAGIIQDITIGTGAGSTANTNCAIVNPTPCDADAGTW
mgnify:CR=1 FL=1